jgi:hypothetical protein
VALSIEKLGRHSQTSFDYDGGRGKVWEEDVDDELGMGNGENSNERLDLTSRLREI